MYLLNNNRLKDRSIFLTWLFFNRRLKKDCKESIATMVEDMNKLHNVSVKADEAKDISSMLKVEDVYHGMNTLYLDCIKAAYKVSRLSYNHVHDIVYTLRALDKILSE